MKHKTRAPPPRSLSLLFLRQVVSLRSPPAPSRLLRLLPKIVNHDPAEMTIGRRVALLSGPWGTMAGGSGLRRPGRHDIREKHPAARVLPSVSRRAPQAKLEGFASIGSRKHGLERIVIRPNATGGYTIETTTPVGDVLEPGGKSHGEGEGVHGSD